MGPLAELIKQYMERGDLSARQAALKTELSHETINKLLDGKVRAPHPATVEKLHRGLGIPVRELREAVARNVEQSYEIEDITSGEALQIAIARIGEVPDEDLPRLREQAQQILDEIKSSVRGSPESDEKP